MSCLWKLLKVGVKLYEFGFYYLKEISLDSNIGFDFIRKIKFVFGVDQPKSKI